ncbi:unnamed protein product [Peronospora effusa]|nr:unnamed protein product [Peronospora effusa]
MRGKGNVRSHLHKLFDIRNQLADLGSPVNDLQMVDRRLRSLPALTCYDELRRKVLFSSNMTKYTPELLREMIITAESRSEDLGRSQQPRQGVMVVIIVVGIILNVIARIWMERRTQEQITRVQAGHH